MSGIERKEKKLQKENIKAIQAARDTTSSVLHKTLNANSGERGK